MPRVGMLLAWSCMRDGWKGSAYAGLEMLNPVNKPIAPHCKVLSGACPRVSSASSDPVFEDRAGSKGAWSVWAVRRLFRPSPSLAFPVRAFPSLLACASGPQERP